MNPTKDPRLAKTELPNESIELSYYKKKVNRLELELAKLELEKSELINQIIRMKLEENK